MKKKTFILTSVLMLTPFVVQAAPSKRIIEVCSIESELAAQIETIRQSGEEISFVMQLCEHFNKQEQVERCYSWVADAFSYSKLSSERAIQSRVDAMKSIRFKDCLSRYN